MFTLYYSPGACSLGTHIVLEWIGEAYEATEADRKSPEFLAVNPAGAVPALRLADGRVLTQSAAILRYLARTHPEARLADDGDPQDAAEIDRWTAFLTGDLHPAFFPLFMSERYTVSQDDAALGDVKAAAAKLVAAKLSLLEAQLGSRDFIVGGRRSIVDAYATPMLRWAANVLPEGLTAYPGLSRHQSVMLADEGVKRAMAAEGLPT